MICIIWDMTESGGICLRGKATAVEVESCGQAVVLSLKKSTVMQSVEPHCRVRALSAEGLTDRAAQHQARARKVQL